MNVEGKRLTREYETTPRPAGVLLVRDVAGRRSDSPAERTRGMDVARRPRQALPQASAGDGSR